MLVKLSEIEQCCSDVNSIKLSKYTDDADLMSWQY